MVPLTRTASTGEVVVELAPHPRSGQIARRAVDDLADSLHPQTMAKVRLLVTELVVAALAPGNDSPLCLTVRCDERAIRAEITPADEGERLAAPARPRHWSLFLVNRIADRWGSDGRTVWFELDAV
jgi:hypothetical protein